ncbi:MAG: CoA-binding protein [Deltaproteobacteria bacterium]|nr:CoA-binding protein [Deltaproteobacteria bacterium]
MNQSISEQLQPIFNARSMAVIGASSAPFKWGAQTVHRLIHFGFRGTVYPINPTKKEIQNLKAYPSVLDVKEDIDLAVITVPAALVPRSMKECVKKGSGEPSSPTEIWETPDSHRL